MGKMTLLRAMAILALLGEKVVEREEENGVVDSRAEKVVTEIKKAVEVVKADVGSNVEDMESQMEDLKKEKKSVEELDDEDFAERVEGIVGN